MPLLAFSISMSFAQRLQQKLGRGVVAVQNGSNVTVTWRRLAQEPESATYNVYVNGSKVNATPLTNTNWKTTTSVVPTGSKVSVTMVANGTESEQSHAYEFKAYDMRNLFMRINFEQGGSPLKSADFNTAYVWPIDLDGDGEFDYVVNRKNNTNGLDCYVEGYLSSGQHLWTVKLGPNELSCAGQDDQITVADMDCDGLGDVVIQSSDGTRFWEPGTKSFGLYVNGSATGDTDGDGIIDYETQNVRNAPRYISVIDGMTGREKASVEQSYNTHYNRTNRASLMGDEYNKHVGHMGVFFHDGIHPAVVMEWHMRGTGGDHHYYNLGVAYDFSSGTAGELKELFNEPTGAPAFHQIRVGDVDGDGCDEMMVGGYTMNNTGKVLFNTGISHGDRFRISDIDPERPGLETFAIQQYAGDMLGQVLYDAGTGEFIKKWYLSAVGDIGRGECMDIDKNHLGWEMWSTMDGNVYDAKGNLISGYGNQYPCEGIWWDNELDREAVQTSDSHYNVYVQDFFKGREVEFAKISNWRYVTVYAKRAAFWGDIIGDWREELVLLHKENGVTVGIVGVSTDYTTDVNHIYCLQEDPHYRGDCTTKGYYQSPNPGFYLGYDMPRPQLPPVMVTDLIYASTATTWSNGSTGFTNYARSAAQSYADGKSVLFDLTSSSNVNLAGVVKPSVVYAMTVKNQQISVAGAGSLEGAMDLWKSQQGRFVINVPMNYTGTTYISEGILEANTTIAGNVELRARGTLAGNATVAGELLIEGALHYEGCRLMPATEQTIGQITLKKPFIISKKLYAEMNVKDADATCDLIHVDGDVTIGGEGELIFTIVPDVEKLQPAKFKLMEYTGKLTGSLDKVSVRGLQGLSYNIVNEDNALWLVVNEQRTASEGVRWTGAVNSAWDYQTENFWLENESTEFVAGDAVTVGDDAQGTTISFSEPMQIKRVVFENEKKTFTVGGIGGFSGSGDFIKNGDGRVNLNAVNSDYTGRTVINSGIVSVKALADGGLPSSIGAASASANNFQMGKATLIIDNNNTSTNRGLTLNDTATIQIANGTAALKGIVQGSGTLKKTGTGQLNLTYDGANSYKSTILQAGTLAMGTWHSTFGAATSPIQVTGNSTLIIFNNNSTSAVPSIRNEIIIEKGKTLTMYAGQRCKIQGSLHGEGTLKIDFPYVRGDFETNCSAFEGTLNPTGNQFRLSSTLDLSKGTFMPGAGVYVAHVKSQSGNEESRTSKIGSLSSTASDCTLATGTWNVGYLGNNDTYAGTFNASAVLNKYGEGTLTLTGASAGALNICEGAVIAANTSKPVTTGTMTVRSGALLAGTGQVQNVTVQKDGTLGAGKSALTVGTLTVNGNLTLNMGAILRVRTSSTTVSTRSDAFKVAGNVKLSSPIIDVTELTSNEIADNAELKIFTGSGKITVTGDITLHPAAPKPGWLWDTSALAQDGILRVVPDPVGIRQLNADSLTDGDVVLDLAGRRISAITSAGLYIVNGHKTYIRK